LTDSAPAARDASDEAVRVELSPVEAIRQVVCDVLVPVANELAERYRPKGIDVSVDASSLLSGERGLVIDISYKGRRQSLEGTAIDEGIAFTENHYFDGMGPTVSTGPMLSIRRLTREAFSEFLYEQIIALVKSESSHHRK